MGEDVDAWKAFIVTFMPSHLRIKEEDDYLIWDKNPTGEYTPNTRYKAICFGEDSDCPLWP